MKHFLDETQRLSLSLSLYGNAMSVNPFHDGSVKTGRFFMKWEF